LRKAGGEENREEVFVKRRGRIFGRRARSLVASLTDFLPLR